MPRKSNKSPIDSFRATFGEGTNYRRFTSQDEARLGPRLPSVMLQLLKEDGWAWYNEQMFWLCNPDDWVPAARVWFPNNPKADVLGRTAFGELVVWDGELFQWVRVHDAIIIAMTDDPDWLFSYTLVDKDLSIHKTLPALIRHAQKKLGRLESDEMYTYVPALALGGSPETSEIEKVKALEALVMLASLSPILRR